MRAAVVGLVLLVVLTAALLSEALFDSAIGAWVAMGAVFAVVLGRVLGLLPWFPDVGD